jgi:pimeloyl-ACP methyl ester carboxylesterase
VEVVYENKKGGVKLAGTLTLPRGPGPHPAALRISGSGAQDRDETLFSHRPFLVLADHLTRRGVAVLRVDDRGVGGSTGSAGEATSADFADDVLAGVEYLKGRKEVDPRRIGLIGHSEGGLIAPAVAGRSADVAFIVLLAGPGLPGDEILYLQGSALLRLLGAGKEQIARQRDLQQRLFAVAKEEKDPAAAEKKMQEVLEDFLAKLPPLERALAGGLKKQTEQQLRALRSPWFRYFLGYDPRPALRKVRCPVLALIGEKDFQVPPKENLPEIEKAVRAGGNPDVTVKELPALNHLFQTCTTGALAEYATIEETFAPSALELLGDWILKRFGSPPAGGATPPGRD